MDDIPSILKTFDFDDTSMTFSPEYTPSVGVSLRAINLTGSTDYVNFRYVCLYPFSF